MGGQGYLQVNESRISVANVDAAYEALESAVTKRTYNFGELRLDKNNKLEIINNHKNTFAFFHKNDTLTTDTENRQVREAVAAILDAKFKTSADADRLALVKMFLCGDSTIASQPLTRDEVANMIRLLDGSTLRDDGAAAFLRDSYGIKHGQVDSRFDDKLSGYTCASENRISENVRRANERLQTSQRAQLMNSLKAMLPKNFREQPPSDGQILKKVFGHVMTHLAATNPAVRLIASQNDPAKLSGAEDVRTYFRNAVANFTRNTILMSPLGDKFLSNMVTQTATDRIRALGGNDETVAKSLRGNYHSAFEDMKFATLTDMAHDKDGWTKVVNGFAADKNPPSLLGEFATLNAVRTSDFDALTNASAAFRAQLNGDFRELMTKLETIDPKQKPADYRAAFVPLANAFQMDGIKDAGVFLADWRQGLGDMLRAFFDGGGDLVKTRTALGGLKEMLRGKLGQLSDELAKIREAADDEKMKLALDNADGRLRIDAKAEASCAECLRRAKPLSDASTLVAFLDTLLAGEDNKARARDFLKALAFSPRMGVAPSFRMSSFETAMVADWLANSSDVNNAIDDLFGVKLNAGLQACRRSEFGEKELDALMDECANQVDSFCRNVLDGVKWGGNAKHDQPIVAAVKGGSEKLVNSCRKNVKDEARVSEFRDLRYTFFGEDTLDVRRAKQVLEQKGQDAELTMLKDFVSSVDPIALERLEDVHAAFANSKIGDTEDAEEDGNLEGAIKDAVQGKIDKAELDKKTEAVFARLGSMTTKLTEKSGPSFVDSVRLLQLATRLPDNMKQNTLPQELRFGIDEDLGHFKITVGDVVQAFSQTDAIKRSAKMLSIVYGRFQDDFGMSKDEIRRFVDPVCVTIVSNVLGRNPTVEDQVEMILRCAIAKAKSVYANENASPDDKQAAQVLLWKMQTAVTQARRMLDPLKGLIAEEKGFVRDFNLKLKNTAGHKEVEALQHGSSTLKAINELLFKRAGVDRTEPTYNDVHKKHLFGMIDRLEKEVVLFDQTGRRDNARAEQGMKFWERSEMFLWRLERLSCTLGGIDVKPSNVDPASRKFVDNVKARFGGDPIINVKGDLNQERFTQLVGTDNVKGPMREDYSLSFNFKE